MTARTHWVYRAYDAGGQCLYVGMTANPEKRRRQHQASAAWWPQVRHCVLRGPYTGSDAAATEKELIGYLLPIWNSAHKPAHRRNIQGWHLRDIAAKHPELPPYRPRHLSPSDHQALTEAAARMGKTLGPGYVLDWSLA